MRTNDICMLIELQLTGRTMHSCCQSEQVSDSVPAPHHSIEYPWSGSGLNTMPLDYQHKLAWMPFLSFCHRLDTFIWVPATDPHLQRQVAFLQGKAPHRHEAGSSRGSFHTYSCPLKQNNRSNCPLLIPLSLAASFEGKNKSITYETVIVSFTVVY